MKKMAILMPVIYYHSVAPRKNPNWDRTFLTLDLKYFEDQLRFFKRNNYETHFLLDYYLHKKGKKILSKTDICLTFDDGFLDNWIYVYPLLKKYKMKATIFISPEFVDTKHPVRKNLEDYWNNKATLEEINCWGYLSWEEMRIMEESGLVDIQSHTLTHTKYFVSDTITGFHRPGADSVYAIANLYPERKPYYIEDPSFEKLIPYGYSIFEEASAIIARRIIINDDFNREVVEMLGSTDWHSTYRFETLYKKIKPVYKKYKERNNLIVRKETLKEYQDRVTGEIKIAKEIIEKKLNKKVKFCCWPHGDNNDFVYNKALELGHLATTGRKEQCDEEDYQRIIRFGLGPCKNNRLLSVLKAAYKIKSYRKAFPYFFIERVYTYLRYREKII